jgi:outer membrane immunogenic protein
MRRNFLASTALTTSSALAAGAAFAADMAVKAPPRPAPIPFSWTGCYIGGNAGGAWTHSDESLTSADPYSVVTVDSSGHVTGFIGGGQLGCNWQFNSSWVVGLEGDINYIHASRTQHGAIVGVAGPGSPGEDTVRSISLRWLATVRGRFGYAWGQSFLYATGGLALGRVKSSSALTDADGGDANIIFAGSQSATRTGWTAGAGYEYGFNDRLSLKLEYLHFDLGKVQYIVPRVDANAACCTPWTASANVTGDIVRLGVNYKFTQ